jgi:hypothetical protein
MSDANLKKIEKAISKLATQQDALCEQVARIETRLGSALAQDGKTATTEETIQFLDQFRAGEALGEASLGAWLEASSTACVKGGLRTVQTREGSHARLLEQRIKELGGSPKFEIPDAIYTAAMEGVADTSKSDAQKVLEFVQRFPDCDAALQPIHDLADRLDHDEETQSLLRTIAQDERSTLEWFSQACAQLNPS